jgi:hypothetical protein
MVAIDKHFEADTPLPGLPRRSRRSRRAERRKRALAVVAMIVSMACVIGLATAPAVIVPSGMTSLLASLAAALGEDLNALGRRFGLIEAGGFCGINDADAYPASALRPQLACSVEDEASWPIEALSNGEACAVGDLGTLGIPALLQALQSTPDGAPPQFAQSEAPPDGTAPPDQAVPPELGDLAPAAGTPPGPPLPKPQKNTPVHEPLVDPTTPFDPTKIPVVFPNDPFRFFPPADPKLHDPPTVPTALTPPHDPVVAVDEPGALALLLGAIAALPALRRAHRRGTAERKN